MADWTLTPASPRPPPSITNINNILTSNIINSHIIISTVNLNINSHVTMVTRTTRCALRCAAVRKCRVAVRK